MSDKGFIAPAEDLETKGFVAPSSDLEDSEKKNGLNGEALQLSTQPSPELPSGSIESPSVEPYKWNPYYKEDKKFVVPKPEIKAVSTYQTSPTEVIPEPKSKTQSEKDKVLEHFTEAFTQFPDAFTNKDTRVKLYEEMYPKLKEAGYNIGDLQQVRDEAEKKWQDSYGLQEHQKQLNNNPSDLNSKYAVATYQTNLGKFQDASKNYEDIILKNPKYSPAYTGLAYIYGTKGNNAMSIDYMDRAIEQNPADASLWNNRAVYKQRVGDIPGAISDINIGISKTDNKEVLAQLTLQRAKIYGKMASNYDQSLTDQYIAKINEEPQDGTKEIDKEYFDEKYKKDYNAYLKLKKESADEHLGKTISAINKAEAAGTTLGQEPSNVQEEMKGFEHSKITSEAMDELLNPSKRGLTGLIMNPIGFIAGQAVESIGGGAKEIKKGIEEGSPIKILKGGIEAAIGSAMAVTPTGLAFTAGTTALNELPYGEYVNKVISQPLTTAMKLIRPDLKPEDIVGLVDVVAQGILFHKVNEKLSGAKEVAKKIENKESLNPDDVKTYQAAVENLGEKDLKNIIESVFEPVTSKELNLEKTATIRTSLLEKRPDLKEVIENTPTEKLSKDLAEKGIPNKTSAVEKYFDRINASATEKPQETVAKTEIKTPESAQEVKSTIENKFLPKEDFVKQNMDLLEKEGEISPSIPKEVYENYFSNLYERKFVKEPLKPKEDVGRTTTNVTTGLKSETPAKVGGQITESRGQEVLGTGTEGSIGGAAEQKLNPESKVLSEAHPKESIDFAKEIIDEGWFHSAGQVFEARPDLGLKTAEINKGINDIRAGKNSADARKVIEALKPVREKGEMPMLRGTGGKTERFGMPLESTRVEGKLEEINPEEIPQAEKIPSHLVETIKQEGITPENFDKISKAIDWLYTPEELNQIKTYLNETRNRPTEDISGTEKPVSESEKLSEAEGAKKPIEGEPQPKEDLKQHFQNVADFLRKGKIQDDIAMATVPFAKEVWNGALEVAAKTIETTGDIVQGVNDAIDYLKKSDWYKNLSDSDKQSAENKIKSNFEGIEKTSTEKAKEIDNASKEFVAEKNSEQRLKSMLETIGESPITSEKLKEAMAEMDKFYKTITNKETIKKADNEIRKDFKAAKDRVLSDEPPSAEKSALTIRIIKQYEKMGDYDAAVDMIDAYDKQLREAGRFIQVASLWNKLAPETIVRIADKIGRKYKVELDKETKKEILKRMSEIDKMPEGAEKTQKTLEVLNYIAEKFPTTSREMFDSFRYQNMLSNPRSHLRNIYSNLFNTFISRPAALTAAATYDLFRHPFNPAAREYHFSDAPKYMKEAVVNIPNAILAFKEVFKNGSISDKILDVGNSGELIESLRQSKMPKALSFVVRSMEAQDRFFSTMISEAERSRLMSKGFDANLAQNKATEIANKYLYREQLGLKKSETNKISQAIDYLGQGVSNLRNVKYVGKPFSWFVPFLRTPINVAKVGIEFTPYPLVEAAVQTLLSKTPFIKGFVGESKLTKEHIGQAMIGSAITTYGAIQAIQGNTTWSVPKDKKEKELFYASGKKPFSVKINNTWVPMSYFGAFGFALAIPAALKNYHEDTKTTLTDSEADKLIQSIGGLSRFIVEQTPFSGVETFFKAAEGDLDIKAGQVAGQITKQFIPLEGFVSYVNKWMDNVYRKTDTQNLLKGWKETIQKDIPEASKYLEPYEDIKGKPATRDIMLNMLPWDISADEKSYDILLKKRRKHLQKLALEAEKEKSKKKSSIR